MITKAEGPTGYLGIAKQTTPGTAVTPLAAPVFTVGAIVRRKHEPRLPILGTVVAEPTMAELLLGKQRVTVRWGNGRTTRVLASELEKVEEEVEVVAGGA